MKRNNVNEVQGSVSNKAHNGVDIFQRLKAAIDHYRNYVHERVYGQLENTLNSPDMREGRKGELSLAEQKARLQALIPENMGSTTLDLISSWFAQVPNFYGKQKKSFFRLSKDERIKVLKLHAKERLAYLPTKENESLIKRISIMQELLSFTRNVKELLPLLEAVAELKLPKAADALSEYIEDVSIRKLLEAVYCSSYWNNYHVFYLERLSLTDKWIEDVQSLLPAVAWDGKMVPFLPFLSLDEQNVPTVFADFFDDQYRNIEPLQQKAFDVMMTTDSIQFFLEQKKLQGALSKEANPALVPHIFTDKQLFAIKHLQQHLEFFVQQGKQSFFSSPLCPYFDLSDWEPRGHDPRFVKRMEKYMSSTLFARGILNHDMLERALENNQNTNDQKPSEDTNHVSVLHEDEEDNDLMSPKDIFYSACEKLAVMELSTFDPLKFFQEMVPVSSLMGSESLSEEERRAIWYKRGNKLAKKRYASQQHTGVFTPLLGEMLAVQAFVHLGIIISGLLKQGVQIADIFTEVMLANNLNMKYKQYFEEKINMILSAYRFLRERKMLGFVEGLADILSTYLTEHPSVQQCECLGKNVLYFVVGEFGGRKLFTPNYVIFNQVYVTEQESKIFYRKIKQDQFVVASYDHMLLKLEDFTDLERLQEEVFHTQVNRDVFDNISDSSLLLYHVFLLNKLFDRLYDTIYVQRNRIGQENVQRIAGAWELLLHKDNVDKLMSKSPTFKRGHHSYSSDGYYHWEHTYNLKSPYMKENNLFLNGTLSWEKVEQGAQSYKEEIERQMREDV